MLSNANVMCRSSFSLFQGLECVYVHMDGGEGCFISSCGTDQLIRAVGIIFLFLRIWYVYSYPPQKQSYHSSLARDRKLL